MSCPWRPASSMSAAAGSSGRSQGGGAGQVTGSTGPGAPYAPGPVCSPMPRPSAWRTSSLMIATLRSRPPGASTSARFQAYRVEDPGLGRFLMQRLIDSLRQAVPDGLEEIQTLVRTMTERAAHTPGLLRPPSTSNGPTEAINGRLEHLRGIALGLRNLTSYTIRSLIHAGRLKDHLAATT